MKDFFEYLNEVEPGFVAEAKKEDEGKHEDCGEKSVFAKFSKKKEEKEEKESDEDEGDEGDKPEFPANFLKKSK